MSGTQDVVIAGGVEVMSLCPIGSSVQDGMMAGHGQPWDGVEVQKKYGEGIMFSQFEGGWFFSFFFFFLCVFWLLFVGLYIFFYFVFFFILFSSM